MISTRGRYALRVLADLAENADRGWIPMKDVAARQGISLKYLERIMPALAQHGYVAAMAGRGGGYKLARAPEECRVGEVLRLMEGTLAPVACLGPNAPACGRAPFCATLPMWKKFQDLTNSFFDGITIADLATGLDGAKTWGGAGSA